MKGRNVIDGEKVERRSNQPSLPPNDSEGPLNTRGPLCLTIWGVQELANFTFCNIRGPGRN